MSYDSQEPNDVIERLKREIARSEKRIADLEHQLEVEGMHADDSVPCPVCSHLELEQLVEQNERLYADLLVVEKGAKALNGILTDIERLARLPGEPERLVPASEILAILEREW